ncbi:ArsR/SmtB family transcription factor [Mycobacterium aquaticum]|uniref:HTH arsR-type domain-containing protein n=1 Tax=Mycobacterium aquaticum TaxID=1927124 RepID=A0A1X0A7G6_9MYCO|nr:metalloregulator ArsR/SmtB family transcription factor [Mycobacterium aquaticum]ORA26021.1 hypothetical protein BST13_32380 [Mycobacterium aquaticum]
MSVFPAIADPVRRRILLLLRGRPLPAGEVAAQFGISRPAVSRHLRVLREAGLVEVDADSSDGRERTYRLRLEALGEVDSWLRELRGPARAAELLAGAALDTEVRRARREREHAASGGSVDRTERKGTA